MLKSFLATLALAFSLSSFAGEPELVIQAPGKAVVFTRSALLKRADVETLTIKDDPAYPGRVMSYKAVPAYKLFEQAHLKGDEVIQFKCLDGFSAPLSTPKLLNDSPSKSVAFVAIEAADAPWPSLKKKGGPTAGPFYLVWRDPALSKIGREEWPFQLASFEVKGSLESEFPRIFPDAKLPANHPVRAGFEVFRKNCFACHTMNQQGESQMGPDFNIPMNPTEYFVESAFRKLVRNPQDLRHWPQSKMPAFDKSTLSDKELDQLIAYLRHMSKRKQPK